MQKCAFGMQWPVKFTETPRRLFSVPQERTLKPIEEVRRSNAQIITNVNYDLAGQTQSRNEPGDLSR